MLTFVGTRDQLRRLGQSTRKGILLYGPPGTAARRSEGTSCAFIKELMRRLAQASLARDGGNSVISADIDEALDDMLFSGGRLNAQLLGGAQAMAAG